MPVRETKGSLSLRESVSSGRDVLHSPVNLPGVAALTTLRSGGFSGGPFHSWNFGAHVGDDASSVAKNRRALAKLLPDEREPIWLNQVHGSRCIEARDVTPSTEADAIWTQEPGIACAVVTADCLPVVFASADSSVVAVAHAGWRGLAAGVLQATVSALPCHPSALHVWLGPAIGPAAFEVGAEVRAEFMASPGASAEHCFIPVGANQAPLNRARMSQAPEEDLKTGGEPEPQKYLADLYGLARVVLSSCGVTRVTGGDHCTYTETDKFFSYRRNGVTGRMATVVVINP